MKWRKFKPTKRDRDGLWLVRTKARIFFGSFYCGEFVRDGSSYNENSGLIRHITHILKVAP